MTEEVGWAGVAEREKERQEANMSNQASPVDNEQLIEFEKNRLLAPLIANELLSEVRDLLVEVVNEMRKANSLATQIDFVPVEAKEMEEFDIPVMDVPEGIPPAPRLNLETEEEVVSYIKGKLAEFTDVDYKLPEADIDKFEIGVEKERVVVKAPWIGKEHFRAFVGFMEDTFEAEYNSTNWHFVFPRP